MNTEELKLFNNLQKQNEDLRHLVRMKGDILPEFSALLDRVIQERNELEILHANDQDSIQKVTHQLNTCEELTKHFGKDL